MKRKKKVAPKRGKAKTARRERSLPVLIVQHAEHEHPAAIQRALESQGIPTLWLHAYRGEKYPRAKDICGVVSLGGPMSANDEDEHSWIMSELKLLRESVERDLPTVGVCLGGQLLARALGAEVVRNDRAEVGWFPIHLNEAGRKDRILRGGGEKPTVYHWHYDTFHLPKGAVGLAGTEVCPRQAYRIGKQVYGFQFHPEADHELVQDWLALQGVEEELKREQQKYGPETVQDAETQRRHAMRGENASLHITAGIGQLFRRAKYEPIERSVKEQYEEWAQQKTVFVIEVQGSDGRTLQIQGQISDILHLPDGEFLIFREIGGILWPIRLDHIRKVLVA